MKMQKKLNVVLVILTVLLISLISFGGVYYKNKNLMSNRIPQFILGTELEGYRKVILKAKENTPDEQQTNSDEEEASSDKNEENTVQEEKSENEESEKKDESQEYFAEDYLKSAEIYRNRFKSLKVQNYSVSCDEETGEIVITLPENDQTDIILSDLTQIGEFTIKDSNTGETLLDNNDVRSVEIEANDNEISSYTSMNINFNTSGTRKFIDVTKEYQNITTNNETQNANNETAEESQDSNTNETQNSSESDTPKKVDIMIDSSKILTTNFKEIIDNGVLSLSFGNATSQDKTSKEELYSAYNLGALIENEALPVEYQVDRNTYISATVEKHTLKSIICFEIGIALVIALGIIIKYRGKGIIASIISLGYIAILLIVLRYANVTFSLEGVLAVELCYLISCSYSVLYCEYKNKKDLTPKEKNSEFKSIVKKYTIIVIPQLIIAILCCFTNWSQLTSFGMVVFWGSLISWLYNILVSKFID